MPEKAEFREVAVSQMMNEIVEEAKVVVGVAKIFEGIEEKDERKALEYYNEVVVEAVNELVAVATAASIALAPDLVQNTLNDARKFQEESK